MEKTNSSSIQPDFQWGKLPPQESSFQLTRSMMEMRKPKAYELSAPPTLGINHQKREVQSEVEIPQCPITLHSIKLLKYIREVQDAMSYVKNTRESTSRNIRSSTELLSPPPFESSQVSSVPRRSRSTSSGKSVDTANEDSEEKIRFSAPEVSGNFRSDKPSKFPNFDDETASNILKKSVATVAAHVGFQESTSSALNVLTGVTEAFIVSFAKSLRDAADLEAESGRTPFYDCLDQALHESGLTSLKDIETFWQKDIIERHRDLKRKAEQAEKSFKLMKNPKKEESKKNVKVEQERPTASSASYGKWTPVTGMSSTPFPSSNSEIPGSLDAWQTQNSRFPVKSEPYDSNAQQNAARYSLSGATSSRVKSEYSGFEFSMQSENIDLSNAERTSRKTDDQLTR